MFIFFYIIIPELQYVKQNTSVITLKKKTFMANKQNAKRFNLLFGYNFFVCKFVGHRN